MSYPVPRRQVLWTIVAASLSATLVRAAGGAVHEVQMLNVDPEDSSRRMIFLPRVLVIPPGDTVRFVPTDASHNSASINRMNPSDGPRWSGRLSEAVEVTFDAPGAYAYQCTPHLAMGMVGLILVEGDGLAEAVAHARSVRQRGKARAVWDDIWAEVDALGL